MKKQRIWLIAITSAILYSLCACSPRNGYWGVDGDVPGGPHYYAGQNYAADYYRSGKHYNEKDYRKWQKKQYKAEQKRRKQAEKAWRKEAKKRAHDHKHHH